jgi:GH15 family glucan-1,4-alpha-glucosidase
MKKTQENTEKIRRMVQVTQELIKDCAMGNGGIVAANSTKSYFPANAKNYFYVWPRDAAYTCLAADIMGMIELQKNFFKWCLTFAEGFRKNGLFYEKYYPNGLKALMNFQPDQTGAVLNAACNYYKHHHSEVTDPEINELITLAANGICRVWNGIHFTEVANDLWEERLCFPDLEENFTYSLASCIKGLRCANEIIPTANWFTTAEEMKKRLDNHFDGFYVRSYGKLPDKRIDASIIGLIYPFEIYDVNDPKIVASVKEIENRLVFNGGVHRYEHDEYDGWMYEGKHMKKGAGAWPLLNFWLSIYYALKNDEEKAKEYYFWVLDKIKDSFYIPEQIFDNDLQVSVSPLLWSHIMFFLATKHLKLA